MEHFVIIVSGWKPLTNITKSSILDVAAALDPPLTNWVYDYYIDTFKTISALLFSFTFQSNCSD